MTNYKDILEEVAFGVVTLSAMLHVPHTICLRSEADLDELRKCLNDGNVNTVFGRQIIIKPGQEKRVVVLTEGGYSADDIMALRADPNFEGDLPNKGL